MAQGRSFWIIRAIDVLLEVNYAVIRIADDELSAYVLERTTEIAEALRDPRLVRPVPPEPQGP